MKGTNEIQHGKTGQVLGAWVHHCMGNNSYITYSNMKDRVYMIDIYHRAAIVVARYPSMSPLSVVDEFVREHEQGGQRVHRKFSREFADKRVRKLALVYRKVVGLIERL